MRSRKIPAPHSSCIPETPTKFLATLIGSMHHLICHCLTALANFQDHLDIVLDDQWMQCTSELGKMLSPSRHTQDESDKTLMKTISVTSDIAIACLSR